jgi:hypothetical protein
MRGISFREIKCTVDTTKDDSTLREKLSKYFEKVIITDDPIHTPPCGIKGLDVDFYSNITVKMSLWAVDDIVPHTEDGKVVYPFRLLTNYFATVDPDKITEFNTPDTEVPYLTSSNHKVKSMSYDNSYTLVWLTKEDYEFYYDNQEEFANDVLKYCFDTHLDSQWKINNNKPLSITMNYI